MADILISGYHGFKNSGDEALLFAILTTLRKIRPDLDVTVLSKNPEDTTRVYGVKSVFRYNFFKVIKEMRNSKMLLFGGGSLLQDVTSGKSILYYLAIIFLAQCHKMKTMLYANGVGPITKKYSRLLSKRILNNVDLITLRDDKSDEELKRLGVNKPKIIITADPAFTIDAHTSMSGRYITNIAGVPDDTKLCIVSLRSWMRSSPDFISEMARLLDDMIDNHNLYPLFVPLQYPADLSVSVSVMQKMKNRAYVINRELTVPEMFSVLSEAQLIIGMRLHSLIYATTLEIPAMALVYDPKVSAFMESLNQPDWVNVETFGFYDAKAVLDKLIENKDARRDQLHHTNAILKKTAEENAIYAINLLDS